jgi:hypothetical protein
VVDLVFYVEHINLDQCVLNCSSFDIVLFDIVLFDIVLFSYTKPGALHFCASGEALLSACENLQRLVKLSSALHAEIAKHVLYKFF